MSDFPKAISFEDLLSDYHAPLLLFVRGLIRDATSAHDVVQDVFVEAWQSTVQRKPPFVGQSDPGSVKRWLFHVAYHHAMSHLRHRRLIAFDSFESVSELQLQQLYEPCTFEDTVAEHDVLQVALSSLPTLDAVCILLNVVHRFTTWEIAQIVEVSPSAAKKRLWRAKERLRNAYFESESAARKRSML